MCPLCFVLILDSPEKYSPVSKFGSFKLGIVDIAFSKEIKSDVFDIESFYKSKFSVQDQGLKINGQKNLKDKVLKDIAVLIGIDDYRVLKTLDSGVVFDLLSKTLKYGIEENIKMHDNQIRLNKIDENTSVIVE